MVKAMNTRTALAAIVAALTLAQFSSRAQPAYRITFRATSYQTDGSGQFVAVPLTEQTLLQDIAQSGGRDPNSLALVYTFQPSGSLGDTIDVVNISDGSLVVNVFGLFFGDDFGSANPLGRTAATNSPVTEIRRLDYIYTQQSFTYTSYNTHSMGASFTAKRVMGDANGNLHATVDAKIHWIVNPQNGNGTKVITGSFTTTKPFVPSG
jgi:hypothetical protein